MNTLSAIHAASALLQRLAVVDATENFGTTAITKAMHKTYSDCAVDEFCKVAPAMGFQVSRIATPAASMLAAQIERAGI